MIFWFIPIVLGGGLLIYFLLKVLSRYEGVSVESAMERVAEMENHLLALEERIKTLETLESDSLLEIEADGDMLQQAESLSSESSTRQSERT
jgi:hypothetical protein